MLNGDPEFCTRVVYFRTGEDKYPIFATGTAFVIEYEESIFVLTAHHVLGDRDPSSLFIAKTQGARQSLPINKLHRLPVADEQFKDFVILRVAADPAAVWSGTAFRVDAAQLEAAHAAMNEGDSELKCHGFPSELRGIDYEAVRGHERRASIDCTLLKPPRPYDRIGQLRFQTGLPFTEVRGMSGSPVFARAPGARWSLAGMITTGSTVDAPAHFIDSVVMLGAINYTLHRPAP